jgi:hypothetical protein
VSSSVNQQVAVAGGSRKSMKELSWWCATGLVFGAFHQMVSWPSRAPDQPHSDEAARPMSAESASRATARSAFQAFAMWRMTSGRLMPSRQYHSSG